MASLLDLLIIIMAIIHIYVFYLEAIAWGKPNVNRIFAITDANAQVMRTMAFNQGFYNLFLAIALVVGFIWSANPDSTIASNTLKDYAALSVLAAGFILWLSNPKLVRPALIQSGPAALYWLIRLL